jgi:hypothetical protein
VGDFTKRVRDGEIAGPLRRAFTQKKWAIAFGDLLTPDVIDHNTHATGLAVRAFFGAHAKQSLVFICLLRRWKSPAVGL